MGRPSSYTTEIFEEICERLCTGEPLEAICRDEGMPASRTVHGWLKGEVAGVPSTVSAAIARARDIGYDAIAERTRLVARGGEGSSGDVQRDKLIIDTDLKLLSKWSKKYGDRQIIQGDAQADAINFTIVSSPNATVHLPSSAALSEAESGDVSPQTLGADRGDD